MFLVKPSFKILTTDFVGMLERIEAAGRTCYKSEAKAGPGTAASFVHKIIERGHESVLEHESISIRFIIDRGVSHELVRHRIASFSQESTRYCTYSGGVTFVIPPWVALLPGERDGDEILREWKQYLSTGPELMWLLSMARAEREYLDLLAYGWIPQQARSVLPNSLKTEIVMTANLREWRHVFRLRCSPAAHPQMREVMVRLAESLARILPCVFDDLVGKK